MVTPPTAVPALDLVDVRKTYPHGSKHVEALRGLTLRVERGSFTAVMGPSGSGKSTFLHCAAGLDTATSGTVRVAGTDLTGMNPDQLTRFRRDRLGFVFQAYNLLPQLTVAENVALPSVLAGTGIDVARRDAILAAIGLGGMASRRPGELSGGQAQRVAIARALMSDPDVMFADEPTGALDTRTGLEVLDLLRSIADDTGQTIVLVTHDPLVAARADRISFIADGQIAGHLEGAGVEQITAHINALGRAA